MEGHPIVNSGIGTGAGSAPVTITCDRDQYALGDTIQVTILNGKPSSIFVTDHGTNCTLVHLQRSVNGSWQLEGQCAMMKATRLVEVVPGALAQTLAPGRGQIKPLMAWPAGTYRIALTYSDTRDLASGQFQPITSATFTIG
ncbi:MAG TPA: hypothetical protein VGN32_06920 [Ktedonobacterales bacterium]|nr:hypothetical protein [Ktedonobacterales bacterium]